MCHLNYAVQDVEAAVVDDLEDQFAEKGVLPCEPLAGEGLAVVSVERLVHEAPAGVGGRRSNLQCVCLDQRLQVMENADQ